ncbi:MAG TPA: hypothetical protein VJK53_05795 [Candidatus Paceibacterota bacterium]
MTHVIEPRDAAFALVLHRFFVRFANTAVSAFVWIILFLYFADIEPSLVHAVIRTFLLYALAQTVTILAAPLALRMIRGNMLRGLVYGTIFSVAALAYMGALTSDVFPQGAAVVGILLGLYRAFYRAPYELEHRAALPQGGPLFAAELFLGLTPFLAGLSVAMGIWYPHLFFVAAAINALALIPLLFTLNVHETYSWGYRQAFAELIANKNQPLVVSGVLAGAGGALLFLIWPILLYFELSPKPLVLGAAFSAALLMVLIIRSRHARVLIDQHADGATYIDEYTVLKEMALAIGRLVISLCAAIGVAVLLTY